jgi:L-asparaginase II
VYCKVGAEGVYCAALPERGFGIAIKMDDGNTARAVEVVMAAAIEALLPLADADATLLRGFSDARIVNWNGLVVGRLGATQAVREVLRII